MPQYVQLPPREEFDLVLTRKGLTLRALCRQAGLDEVGMCRARAGRQKIQMATWRKLVATLSVLPDLPGIDLLMPTHTKNAAQ